MSLSACHPNDRSSPVYLGRRWCHSGSVSTNCDHVGPPPSWASVDNRRGQQDHGLALRLHAHARALQAQHQDALRPQHRAPLVERANLLLVVLAEVEVDGEATVGLARQHPNPLATPEAAALALRAVGEAPWAAAGEELHPQRAPPNQRCRHLLIDLTIQTLMNHRPRRNPPLAPCPGEEQAPYLLALGGAAPYAAIAPRCQTG